MPILKEGTPEYDNSIGGLYVNSPIDSRFHLPDFTRAFREGGDVAGAVYDKDDIADRSSAASNVALEYGLAGISTAAGIPTSNGLWNGASKLIDVLPEQLVEDFNVILRDVRGAGDLAQGSMEMFNNMKVLGDFPERLGVQLVNAFDDFLGPTFDVISGVVAVATSWIPILGSLVQIGTSLARIFGAGAGGDSEWVEPVVSPMSFVPSLDADFAGAFMLKPMRGDYDSFRSTQYGTSFIPTNRRSLNNIFHPVGIGAQQAVLVEERDVNGDLVSEGVRRISGKNVQSMTDRKWAGMLPGSTLLDRGWEIGRDGSRGTGTRNLGGLLPTGADLGSKLWGMIKKPGNPLMYTLSPRMLRKQWVEYLWGVRVEVEARTWWSEAAKAEFINNVAGPAYGWSRYSRPGTGGLDGNKAREVAHGSGTKIVDKDISFGLPNSVPIKELENLEALQRGAMDNTIVCAYVDESFYIPDRDRWRESRMALLQHPLRCGVDTSSIPDKDYRNAMIAAKANVCDGMTLTASMAPLRTSPARMVAVSQGLSSPGGGGGIEELTGEGESGKAGLLVAAAVLGLIVLSKKNR